VVIHPGKSGFYCGDWNQKHMYIITCISITYRLLRYDILNIMENSQFVFISPAKIMKG
jgi:hypothetical protein